MRFTRASRFDDLFLFWLGRYHDTLRGFAISTADMAPGIIFLAAAAVAAMLPADKEGGLGASNLHLGPILGPRASLETDSIIVNCTLYAIEIDIDLGTDHATGGIQRLCEGENGRTVLLSDDAASRTAMEGLRHDDQVHLELLRMPMNLQGEQFHRVVAAQQIGMKRVAARTGSAVSAQAVSDLVDANRYFSGSRSIRLLSVIVSLNGQTADYAGSTQSARESWAADQRSFMSNEMAFSTYSKLKFDHSNSRVMTANLGTVSLTHSSGSCSNIVFEICERASDQLSVSAMSNIDAVVYYQPEAASPQCGRSGSGTLGICSIGLLCPRQIQATHCPADQLPTRHTTYAPHETIHLRAASRTRRALWSLLHILTRIRASLAHLSANVNRNSASPPYILGNSRSRRSWNARCMVRCHPNLWHGACACACAW